MASALQTKKRKTASPTSSSSNPPSPFLRINDGLWMDIGNIKALEKKKRDEDVAWYIQVYQMEQERSVDWYYIDDKYVKQIKERFGITDEEDE